MFCPNEQTAKSLWWKRACKTILSHTWVGLLLWPAWRDGTAWGEGSTEQPAAPLNLAQLQLPAAPYKHWTLPRFFFPHHLSILRLCSLFPGCLFCLDPKLHTEGTSALKLCILQRALFTINGHCHSCDLTDTNIFSSLLVKDWLLLAIGDWTNKFFQNTCKCNALHSKKKKYQQLDFFSCKKA